MIEFELSNEPLPEPLLTIDQDGVYGGVYARTKSKDFCDGMVECIRLADLRSNDLNKNTDNEKK